MPRKTPAPERRRSPAGRTGPAVRDRSGGAATRSSGRATTGTTKRATGTTATRTAGRPTRRTDSGATKQGAGRGRDTAGRTASGGGRSSGGEPSPAWSAGGRSGTGARGGAGRSGSRGSGRGRPPRRSREERAATFRRRRIAVGLLALVLVAGVAVGAVRGVPLLLERFGPDRAEPSAEPTEEPTGPDEEALANPVGCLPEAVSLELGMAGAEVAAGTKVEVPITITNTGQVPCLLDVGNDALQLEVTSGNDTVWTTAQCPAGTAEQPILLPVGGMEETTISWSGRRSAADCPDDTREARAGTYQIEVSIAVDGDEVTQRRTLTLT